MEPVATLRAEACSSSVGHRARRGHGCDSGDVIGKQKESYGPNNIVCHLGQLCTVVVVVVVVSPVVVAVLSWARCSMRGGPVIVVNSS